MNRGVLVGVGIALVVAGGGATWMMRRNVPAAPSAKVSAAQVEPLGNLVAERSKGDSAAPIIIYEFSDFQCPYCRQFWEKTWPALEREYIATGKARLIFVNYPIPQIHPNATAAHNFAMCAARQGRFWPAHDLLFERQKEWEKLPDPNPYFRRLGEAAKLDADVLLACLDQRSEDWLVQSDTREAANAGITGTPAFLVNGALLPGAQPLEIWKPILDSMYRAGPQTRTP
jgi:protein-disulfide isomerase